MATIGNVVIKDDDSVKCKACGKSVVAEFAVELTDRKDIDDQQRVTLGGKITGMRISHDCMPVTPRGRAVADRPQA